MVLQNKRMVGAILIGDTDLEVKKVYNSRILVFLDVCPSMYMQLLASLPV